MAIYVDANVLHGLTNRSLEWRALRAIAQAHHLEIVIPEIALSEAVANRQRDITAKSAAVRGALDKARGWLEIPEFREPDAQRVADAWRTEMLQGVRYLAASADHAYEALNREVRRLPPAQGGEGARDAAIWLAIRDDHRSRAEPGYFVSGNFRDFGEPPEGRLHQGLQAEVAGGEPFIYVHRIADLLPHLAESGGVAWTVGELESIRGLRAAVTNRLDDLSAGFDTLNRLIESAYGGVPRWSGVRTSVREASIWKIPSQSNYRLPDGQEIGILRTSWAAFVDISFSGPRELIEAGYREGLGAVLADVELWARRDTRTGERDFMVTAVDKLEVARAAADVLRPHEASANDTPDLLT